MTKSKLIRMIGYLIMIVSVTQCVDLSLIDLISNNTLIVNSIQASSGQLIWLQQARENPSTTNKKVFYRVVYDDFTSSTVKRYKFQDINEELQLKAWDENEFRCGLFSNTTSNSFFIYTFPQSETATGQIINLSEFMTYREDNSTLTFKLSSDCDTVLINNLEVYIYHQYTQYNYGTEEYYEVKDWDWVAYLEGYNILGFDSELYSIVTTEQIFVLYSDFVYDYYFDQNTGDYIEYWYTYYEYYYGTPLDLSEFQGGNAQVEYYYYSSDNEYEDSHERIVIFANKETTQVGVYNYSLIAICTGQDIGTNVVHQSTQQSNGTPYFTFSQKLSKVIVYGNNTNSKPFYEGYFFNYTEGQSNAITFPTSITKYSNFLTMTQHFLYCRNKNIPSTNKGNHSAYVFAQQSLFSYFEQKVITENQYNSNWVSAHIETSSQQDSLQFLDLKMTFVNLFTFSNQYYFNLQQAGSFNELQKSEYNTFVEYKYSEEFGFITSDKSTTMSAQKEYRWAYTKRQNPMPEFGTIYIKTYNISTKYASIFQYTVQNKPQFALEDFMFSQNVDCFYIPDNENFVLSFYTFNGAKIEYLADIVVDGISEFPTSNDPKQNSSIQIASKCRVIKVWGKTFSLSSNTDPIQFIETPNSPFDMSIAIFDSTLMFALQNQQLYKYNGVTYQNIANSTFTGSSQLLSSQDQTKILIRTYNQTTQTITNTTTNKNKTLNYNQVKYEVVYQLKNSTWKSISLNNTSLLNKKITSFISPLIASANLDKSVFCYTYQNSTPKNQCIFITIDYTKELLYESFYQFQSPRSPKMGNFGNKYIYILEAEQLTINKVTRQVNCQQKIFTVDKSTIQLLSTYGVECSQYGQGFMKRVIIQNTVNSMITFYYEYLIYNEVKIIKGPTQAIQTINNQLLLSSNSINKGFFTSNLTLYQCTPGCLSCYNSYYCSKCVSGYSLNAQNYKCVKCDGYCETCNVDNTTECYTCPVGFYFDKSKVICIKCHSNCQSCTGRSDTKCTTCKIGYFLNNNIEKKKKRTCISCPSNCESCTNSSNCISCQFGFGFALSTSGSCVKCPLDCIVCDPSNVINCISCRTGFQLITIQGKKQCLKCPIHCQTCTGSVCSKCRTGYSLNAKENACYENCLAPCKQCSLTDSTVCLSCITGFILNGTLCQPDISCNDKLKCIGCPSGYALISKKCYQCTMTSNCLQCQSNNPTLCVSCQQGFYLMNDLCEPCSSSCQRCYAPSICQKCRDGYMLSWRNSTASGCMACAANCKTCVQSSTNCESCLLGYKLIGASCVSQKIVQFTVKINLDFANFNNDIYNQIISEIATVSSKLTTQVKITSIKSGSVSIQGSVDVTNTNQQINTLSALNTALSSGSKIAGSQILQSKFVGFTPVVVAQPQTKSNLVMILAIVIPGCVILVGLLVLFIYKKFFAPKEVIPVRQQSDRSSQTDISQKGQKKQVDKPQKKSKNGFMPKVQRRIKPASNPNI